MDCETAQKICCDPDRIDNAKYSDVPNFQVYRKCKKCLNRRYTDIAESLVSNHVIALTLTYVVK